MHSFFVAPSSFDVITVTGPDSVRFLQGQLTCDVASVEEGGFCYGAVCNNKGRVVVAFTLIRWQDCYYLCMVAGLGAILLATLKKYLPFYKCSMQQSPHLLYALAGSCVRQVPGDAATVGEPSPSSTTAVAGGWLCVLDTAAPRALLLTSEAPEFTQNRLQHCPAGTLEQWEALGMLAGHYPFRAGDTEQFTPQELHFDRNGYVSFSKGCYTGQEIVARMHYRGKLKKQLYLLTIDTGTTTTGSTGAPIIIRDSENNELGHTLTSRTLGQQTLALAQLPVALSETQVSLVTHEGLSVRYISFSA